MCAVCMAAPVCGTSCVALNPSYHSWIPASGSNAIQRSAKRTVAQRRQLVAVANCSQQSSTSMAQGSLGLGTAEDSPQSVTHATLVSLMPDARDQAHTMQAAFGSSQHQLDGTQAICMVANLKALSDGGFSKADVRSVLICCPQILTAAVQVQPWLTFLKAYGLSQAQVHHILLQEPCLLTRDLVSAGAAMRHMQQRAGLAPDAVAKLTTVYPQLLWKSTGEIDSMLQLLAKYQVTRDSGGC